MAEEKKNLFETLKDRIEDVAEDGIALGKKKEAIEAKKAEEAAAKAAEELKVAEEKAAAEKKAAEEKAAAEKKAADNSAYKLDVDGQWGPKTVKTTQHILGITEDGICGVETIKAIQKKVGATVDGNWGSGTSTAMQKFLGNVEVDGVRGPETVKAWQTWCNKQL